MGQRPAGLTRVLQAPPAHGKGRLGAAWAGPGPRTETALGGRGARLSHRPDGRTAIHWRGTAARARRLTVQGPGAPCAAGTGGKAQPGVLSLQLLAGRPGEGASPDRAHQLLPVRRGARRPAAGQGERSARPMARSVNKSGPHAGPRPGRRAARHGSIPAAEPAIARGDSPPPPASGTPRPGPSLSARPQEAASKAPSPAGRGSPALRVDPRSPPRVSDRQGERPGSVTESPAWRCPGRRQRQTATRTHMHSRSEVDKNRPTETKCRHRREPALTSCRREDRPPTPGHCHFHSAPATWTPLPRLPPHGPSSRDVSPPPECANAKTIRAASNRGELGPAGNPGVRETGSGRAQRSGAARASSPRPPGWLQPAGPRTQPAVLTRDARPGCRRRGPRRAGTPGSRGCRDRGDPGSAETRARRRRRCSARRARLWRATNGSRQAASVGGPGGGAGGARGKPGSDWSA